VLGGVQISRSRRTVSLPGTRRNVREQFTGRIDDHETGSPVIGRIAAACARSRDYCERGASRRSLRGLGSRAMPGLQCGIFPGRYGFCCLAPPMCPPACRRRGHHQRRIALVHAPAHGLVDRVAIVVIAPTFCSSTSRTKSPRGGSLLYILLVLFRPLRAFLLGLGGDFGPLAGSPMRQPPVAARGFSVPLHASSAASTSADLLQCGTFRIFASSNE